MPQRWTLRRFVVLLALTTVPVTATVAQTRTHEVAVTVPDIIGIRIVGSGSGPRSVTFDYAADPDGYFAAIDGDGNLTPTAVNRFDDIQVNVTRNGRWRVHVAATAFAYTGPATPSGLALSDVRVERSGPQDAITGPGGSASYATTWTLSTSATEIATRRGATGGWRSMGVSGWDYWLTVDGDEASGTYTTVVTYSLTAP